VFCQGLGAGPIASFLGLRRRGVISRQKKTTSRTNLAKGPSKAFFGLCNPKTPTNARRYGIVRAHCYAWLSRGLDDGHFYWVQLIRVNVTPVATPYDRTSRRFLGCSSFMYHR